LNGKGRSEDENEGIKKLKNEGGIKGMPKA
jgi:hypothetical protein